MTFADCADMIDVYFRGKLQGQVDEHDARAYIARKEAWLDRENGNRRLVMRAEETASKVRALSGRDATGGTVSPTYMEELYTGSKRDGSAIVTGRCYSLKKMAKKGSQMVPYRENEGFTPRRFNPDRLPVGLIPVQRNNALPASWQ